MSKRLPLLGYIFVAIVAIIAALGVRSLLMSVLLIISSIVSLILAITRIISAKKTEDRIKYLEEHHLSSSKLLDKPLLSPSAWVNRSYTTRR